MTTLNFPAVVQGAGLHVEHVDPVNIPKMLQVGKRTTRSGLDEHSNNSRVMLPRT